MTRRALGCALFSLLSANIFRGQPSAPVFDVASVKLNKNCRVGVGRASISPRNLALPCMSLRALIRLAYGDTLVGGGFGAHRMEVEGGPGWLDSDRYDVLAKSEGNSGALPAVPMLQALLEERFKVKVHKEARDSSVYLLTAASGGIKLHPIKEGSCTPIDLNNLQPPVPPKPGEPVTRQCGGGTQRTSDGSLLDWYGVTMPELAGRMLPGAVDRPVVDQTRLSERFDIHIEYVRENHMSRPVTLNGVDVALPPPAETSSGPSIFSALEKQLGLKLSPGRAPLDVIIVDHAERPSEN